jgi:hypothetical protein
VALNYSSQFRRAPYSERGVDLRNTPRVATEALVCAYPQLPDRLWEPATGLNSITDVLRESGRQVLATDLIDCEIEDRSCYGSFSWKPAGRRVVRVSARTRRT